jgi:hypothetical protein
MKWLLITACDNPGDAFARIGCQRLIESVDPAPRFDLYDKERRTDIPGGYDRAAICGMPLFWSHGIDSNWRMPWWPRLCRIAEETPTIGLGIGSVAPWPNGQATHSESLRDSAWGLGSIARLCPRENETNRLCQTNWPVIACPSIFSTCGKSKQHRVCNLMPGGNHWRQYGPEQSAAFDRLVHSLAQYLVESDFVFVAHSEWEADYAAFLGFPKVATWMGDPHHLLHWYAHAECYVGCRVHGALPVRGAGGRALCLTYDTRAEAVIHAGGQAWLPSETTVDRVREWVGQQQPVFNTGKEWDRQRGILEAFHNGAK